MNLGKGSAIVKYNIDPERRIVWSLQYDGKKIKEKIDIAGSMVEAEV